MDNKADILREYESHYKQLLKTREPATQIEEETEEIVNSTLNLMKNYVKPVKTDEYEIERAIKLLKPRKAKDRGEWQNEMMIYGGNQMTKSLKKIFDMISRLQQIPKQWEIMRIKSIFKDARIKQVDKTRGLFITNLVSKLQERVIFERNKKAWDQATSSFQCGGKRGTSTVDHTLTLLELINRNKYLNKETFLLFVDMEKCFDKLWLASGVVELWKSGMMAHDAHPTYCMNRIAHIELHI